MTNDCLLHMCSHYQGFGGVGGSGYGRYSGLCGFKNFSNRKGCLLKRPAFAAVRESAIPPFTDDKIAKIRSGGAFLSGTTQWMVVKCVYMFVIVLVFLITGYMTNWNYGLNSILVRA